MPRSSHPSAVPVQLTRTRDGWIFLMCMTQKFWQELLRISAAPELADDARFATPESRRQHRDELTPVLDTVFQRDSTAGWLERLKGALPAAPVYDMPQALDNDFPNRTGMIRNVPHPLRADFRSFANPIKLDGARLPSRPGPALGADTGDVLREIGVAESELAGLRQRNVI
jgi:crotonobetainyl-CoA:carnitine CoA-transferase CaiB-like acyl-CoA transferase